MLSYFFLWPWVSTTSATLWAATLQDSCGCLLVYRDFKSPNAAGYH